MTKYEQARELVFMYWRGEETGDGLAYALHDMLEEITTIERESGAAIAALMVENDTLRTEKHADAEAIGALREALSAMLDLQDNASPFGGEMYQDRVDRVFYQCRKALKGDTP